MNHYHNKLVKFTKPFDLGNGEYISSSCTLVVVTSLDEDLLLAATTRRTRKKLHTAFNGIDYGSEPMLRINPEDTSSIMYHPLKVIDIEQNT